MSVRAAGRLSVQEGWGGGGGGGGGVGNLAKQRPGREKEEWCQSGKEI